MLAFAQERQYTVGTSIDVVGGRTNNLTGSRLTPTQEKPFYFYGAYPSLTLLARGARSTVNASYAFGSNRTETDTKLHSNSHSGTINFTVPLSQRWRINFSEGLQITGDAATFNGFRGVTTPVEDFRFVFNPVAVQLRTRSNSAGLGADYAINGKSSFSFSGSHNLLDYGNNEEVRGSLSNQQRMTGSVTYSRQTGRRDTWSLGYTMSYFDFTNFQNSLSDTGHVGYSTQIGRDLNFQLTVGASRTENLESRESQVGFNTSASLQKTFQTNASQTNSFALHYTQTSGESSGLGSISKTRSAGISFRRDTKRVLMFVDISAFETTGTLGNALSTRGIQGAATIGLPLTTTFSIQGGGQYQAYDRSSPFGFDQRRVFISLRYNNPTLLRFTK